MCKNFNDLKTNDILVLLDCFPSHININNEEVRKKIFLLQKGDEHKYNCFRWASKQKQNFWVVVDKNTQHLNYFKEKTMQFLNCGGNPFKHESTTWNTIMSNSKQTNAMKLCADFLLDNPKNCNPVHLSKELHFFNEMCSTRNILMEMKKENLYKLNTVLIYFKCSEVGPIISHAAVYTNKCNQNMWTHKIGANELIGVVDYEDTINTWDGYGFPLYYGESLP